MKTDPAFTASDAEELKGHLIDLSEELYRKGLSEEEAFLVASSRLGVNNDLKEDFNEVNQPFIQMRKAILMLSGILLFFYLYFLMMCSIRLLLHEVKDIVDDQTLRMHLIIICVIAFHLLFVIASLFLYFSGEKMIRKIVELKIRPYLTITLFLGILFLSIAERWLHKLNNQYFLESTYTGVHMFAIADYTSYTYPLVLIVCFIVLYKKFYPKMEAVKTDALSATELPGTQPVSYTQAGSSDQLVLDLAEMEGIELTEEERRRVAELRIGRISGKKEQAVRLQDGSMSSVMMVMAGVLFYFFLYYLMLSTARMLFCAMQYLDMHIARNLIRTWSYVICFQSFFVVFTAGLYFRDRNIVDWLNRRQLKPVHTRRLLYGTIFLATVDRCFFPIAKILIRAEGHGMVFDYIHIFNFCEYSFPFILGTCFLVLFYKYYRDHVQTVH